MSHSNHSDQIKKQVSLQSLFALNAMILIISGLKVGLGPFFAVYLKSDLHWNPNQIGIALGIVNLAAMLNQIPSGLMIDALKIKRLLLGSSCLIIAISCFLISQFSLFSAIVTAQFFIGLAIVIIPQGIAAITLGLVGITAFPKRQSINEALSHIGNILIVLLAGLAAYFYGNIWIIYIYGIFAFMGIFPLFFIKEKEIDHDIARLLPPLTMVSKNRDKIVSIKKILSSHVNIIFLISVFLFHFASAAQLTLVGQLFVLNNPKDSPIFMGSSIIVSHFVMLFVAIILRFYIQDIRRKPLILLAFLFVFTRGILFTVSHNSYFMIGVQAVDGMSAGIFGVISVVIISELSKNSGRFNFMLGLTALCQAIAYALSNAGSGYIAKLYGFDVGFFTLASFAMLGFYLFLFAMPETLKKTFY